MGKSRGDFTEILLKRQILGPDQLGEAKAMQQQTGAKLQDTIVKLGYATNDEVLSAIAEFHGMQFVNLTDSHFAQLASGNPPNTLNRTIYYNTVDKIPSFANIAAMPP